MKPRILLGLGMLLAGSSMAVAQTDVPGYPGVKVVPVDKSAAPTPPDTKTKSGEDVQHQLFANLTDAGFTNVKIMPDAFIVEATNKAGEPVKMFLTPDSMTIFTATDAKGHDSRTAPAESSPSAAK